MPLFMEIRNGCVVVTTKDLQAAGIESVKTIKSAINRRQITAIQRGLYTYESLGSWQALVKENLCAGLEPSVWLQQQAQKKRVENLFRLSDWVSEDALELSWLLQQPLEGWQVHGYARLCGWLRLALGLKGAELRKMGLADKDRLYAVMLLQMKPEYDEKLLAGQPISNVQVLKRRITGYKRQGVQGVVNQKNLKPCQNARKVNAAVERVLLCLANKRSKPYPNQVLADYQAFLAGSLPIVDVLTAELYDPATFRKGEKLLTLSESTVKNVLKDPDNQAVLAKMLASHLEYDSKHRPFVHRLKPSYSLSKISMDDRQLPFKLSNGKKAWAYLVFDVLSGCVVGVATGHDKNRELFKAALADMIANPTLRGKMPLEIEIEQHIASTFKQDLLKQGEVFTFVRFCLGGNAKEKHAENNIRGLKYGQEKNRAGFQFRPFARLSNNRLNQDEKPVTYTLEQVSANLLTDIAAYHAELHPNQGLYPGMTRLQVLEAHLCPDCPTIELPKLARYVGQQVGTSIQNSQYVRVKNGKYHLPSPRILEQINSLEVQAYYLPDKLEECIWLYQGENYLGECKLLERFQTAQSEQTEADVKILADFRSYRKEYDTMIREKTEGIQLLEVVKPTKRAVKPISLYGNDDEEAPIKLAN